MISHIVDTIPYSLYLLSYAYISYILYHSISCILYVYIYMHMCMCVPLQTSLQFWPRCQGFGPERRKNSGLETAPIQSCKQTTFHKTFTHVKDKIYKNCTGPNFSARPSRKSLALAARAFCHRPALLSRSKRAAVSARNPWPKMMMMNHTGAAERRKLLMVARRLKIRPHTAKKREKSASTSIDQK